MDDFNTQVNSKPQIQKKIRNLLSGPKIIFVILGIIILVEVVYAVKVLSTSTPLPPVVRKAEVKAASGKMSLIAPKTSFVVKEVVPVKVMIDTGSRTLDGADLMLSFDPKVLEATSGAIIRGNIFDEYPLMSVDSKKGLITISGINSIKKGFNGIGELAVINFKAKVIGSSALTIDFKKDLTSDSNLTEAGTSKDILNEVINLELNIQ